MTMREQVEYMLAAMEHEAPMLDGLDGAIIGLTEIGYDNSVVVYSYEKVIEILMERDGMDLQGAKEFFEYNIEPSSPAPSPIFVRQS